MKLQPPEDSAGRPRIEMYGESRDDSTFTQIGTQIVQPLPPSGLAVRYSLPPDIAAFTGRDAELNLMTVTATAADAIVPGGVVAIHAIGGMPGVGKTALAVHIAHLLRDRFPDRQLFIDLHAHTPGQDPASPEAALAGLLTAVGVDPRYLPEGLEGRAGLWRDRMAGQRAVLVLDNAASSDQVSPLLPGGGGCLVLVTSRRHLADLPGAVAVPLDALPPDKAQAMFLRLAIRAAAAPESAVQELVRLAGYLPLAISLLARVYAKHPAWNLGDLIRETKASLLTLAAEKDCVAAAFDVSYRNLAGGQQEILRRLGLHLGTKIDAYAAAALADISLAEAAGQLDALHREGLLTETGYRRYAMHDLLRRYAQDRADDDPAADRDQAQHRLLDYYQYTATVSEARLARQSSTRRPAPDALAWPPTAIPSLPDRALALSWARIERGNLFACLDYATRAGQHDRVIALTAAVAVLLRVDGPWTEAAARHNAAARAARQLGDRLAEAGALSEIGVVRRLSGDYPRAAGALDAALAAYRALGDRLGQASALRELGAVQCYTGAYSHAAQALDAALDTYNALGDRLGQASALSQLAVVRYLTGDYREAVQALNEALGICRGIGDQLGQAHALNQLGVVRRQTGDYQGAAEALEEAQAICRDLGDRLGLANSLNELGMVRRQTGDYQGAAEVLGAALEVCRDLGYRRGQANTLLDLGAVRRLTGDFPGAAQALEVALATYRDLGDRGGEVEVLNETGALHRVRGDLERAEACHLQAQDLAGEIGSSWDEAHALAGLGRCFLAAGRLAEAQTRLRQAWKIFQRIGGAEAVSLAAELDAIPETGPAA